LRTSLFLTFIKEEETFYRKARR